MRGAETFDEREAMHSNHIIMPALQLPPSNKLCPSLTEAVHSYTNGSICCRSSSLYVGAAVVGRAKQTYVTKLGQAGASLNVKLSMQRACTACAASKRCVMHSNRCWPSSLVKQHRHAAAAVNASSQGALA